VSSTDLITWLSTLETPSRQPVTTVHVSVLNM